MGELFSMVGAELRDTWIFGCVVWRHPEVVLEHGLSGWPNSPGYGTARF